jgi:hypothetical protein
LRAIDLADLRLVDFEDRFPLAARRPLTFDPRVLLLVADVRDLPDLFEPALDFLAEPDRLLPPEDLFAPDDFRPFEDLRPPLFLLEDFPRPMRVARLAAARFAAPAACFARAFAFATLAGLLAALPAMAPMSPPTTVPTGPPTLPTTAPAAAPAVVFEIAGTSRFSEEELPDDCWSCSAIR